MTDDSSIPKVFITNVDCELFIDAPMELLRNIVADASAAGKNLSGVAQVIAVVITELELQALTARLTNRTHVFQGKLTVAAALERSHALRQLDLNA